MEGRFGSSVHPFKRTTALPSLLATPVCHIFLAKSLSVTHSLTPPTGLILETDMGVHMTDFAAKAGLVDISTAKSAENIVKVLRGLKPEDNGKFFNHDGTNIPW